MSIDDTEIWLTTGSKTISSANRLIQFVVLLQLNLCHVSKIIVENI